MLIIAALALASGTAGAYEITESRYRVEVAPGKFQDQLVLKCDNGRTVIVPWDAKLYEACGEDVVGHPARAGHNEEAPQDRQKQVMMSRVREQYGNIDERYVQFQSGPAGPSMQFQGPIRDILKRYEICRKQTKNSPTCVAERDQAMAALASPDAHAAAQPPAQPTVEAAGASEAKSAPEARPSPDAKPAAKPKKSARKPAPQIEAKSAPKPDAHLDESAVPGKHVAEPAPVQPPAKPAAVPAAAAETPAPVAAAEAAPAKPMPQPVAPEAPAATPPSEAQLPAEQKIAQDFAWCMRAKPKFECEQARARAQAALAKPKTAKPTAKSKGGTGEAVPVKAVYQQPVSQ
jgi:hypothetical protein